MTRKAAIFLLLIVLTNLAFTAEADTFRGAWLELGFGLSKVDEVMGGGITRLALLNNDKIYSIHFIDLDDELAPYSSLAIMRSPEEVNPSLP